MWVQQAEGKKGRAAHWRCQSVAAHTGKSRSLWLTVGVGLRSRFLAANIWTAASLAQPSVRADQGIKCCTPLPDMILLDAVCSSSGTMLPVFA